MRNRSTDRAELARLLEHVEEYLQQRDDVEFRKEVTEEREALVERGLEELTN